MALTGLLKPTILVLALGLASPALAVGAGGDPTLAAPEEPSAPGEPSGPEGGASPWIPSKPLIVRPHLEVGLLTDGGSGLGFAFAAGLRFHPVLVLYSAWVAGAGEDYMTYSGVKVGYQHTLARWLAAYGAVGVGSVRYHFGNRETMSGSATTLDVGITLGEERTINFASLGVQVVIPSGAGLPAGSKLDQSAVFFVFAIDPILMLMK